MRLLPCLVLLVLPTAARADVVEQPKLAFTVEGKELTISATVSANNSPHVVWTHAIDLGKDVFLYYHVIQNRDLAVRGAEATRSRKSVELKWKLTGVKPSEKVFHVRQEFVPNTTELRQLLPQLQKLAEAGPKTVKDKNDE